ncbi:MAG: ATP-grasp domain-containing protein [Candidatus Njordarchaeum guaymaensis]
MRILVTGAGGPAGWNAVKSLKVAPEKIFVAVTDINKMHLEYLEEADKHYIVPRCTEPGYIDILNEIIERDNITLVHAQPDIEVRVISENRERLNAMTFLPSKEAIRILQDKYKSAQTWKNKGIAVPDTIELHDKSLEKDLEKAFDKFGSPIWIRAKHGAGGRGSTPAYNLETAIHWIKYWRSRGINWEFIAQEYLPGRNIAFMSVWKDGELIVSQARERLEYIYPYLAPSGITGTPTIARTIHDDNVNRIATEAILAVDPKPNGVYSVDMRENREGIPCLTEINAGRFFTTSFFFTYAGLKYGIWYANMPYLLVKLAHGKVDTSKIPKYNILPEGLYWIRHLDTGYHLVKEGNWRGIDLTK